MNSRISPRYLQIILFCLITIIVIGLAWLYLPTGVDWEKTYRPASLAFLSGKSPYSVDIFYAAPWTLIPLLPFALLPTSLGRALLFLVGLVSFTFTAYRLGATRISLVAFLLSPPVIHCLLNSNIEWLPLLGVVMPPQIGLFFITVKPQIGIGIGFYWFVEAWLIGGIRRIVWVFWPITLAFLVSFMFLGVWPLRFRDTLVLTRTYNASLWPYTIPVGFALLAASVRLKNIKYAMASSPCLSPYVLLHAWVGSLASIVALPFETVAAVMGLWILVIIRLFSSY